jgi:hypothetical protein
VGKPINLVKTVPAPYPAALPNSQTPAIHEFLCFPYLPVLKSAIKKSPVVLVIVVVLVVAVVVIVTIVVPMVVSVVVSMVSMVVSIC